MKLQDLKSPLTSDRRLRALRAPRDERTARLVKAVLSKAHRNNPQKGNSNPTGALSDIVGYVDPNSSEGEVVSM